MYSAWKWNTVLWQEPVTCSGVWRDGSAVGGPLYGTAVCAGSVPSTSGRDRLMLPSLLINSSTALLSAALGRRVRAVTPCAFALHRNPRFRYVRTLPCSTAQLLSCSMPSEGRATLRCRPCIGGLIFALSYRRGAARCARLPRSAIGGSPYLRARRAGVPSPSGRGQGEGALQDPFSISTPAPPPDRLTRTFGLMGRIRRRRTTLRRGLVRRCSHGGFFSLSLSVFIGGHPRSSSSPAPLVSCSPAPAPQARETPCFPAYLARRFHKTSV